MFRRKVISTLMRFLPLRKNGFRILTYHSVRPVSADGPSAYVVDPDSFARQIEFLSEQRCNVVPLSTALRTLQTGASLPVKTLVLSFDDGYRDNLVYAAPILRPFGYTPVVFVCPELFGRPAGCYGEFVAHSPFLTRDEIVELMRMGWEIGGHTNTHLSLTRCQSGEELDRELAGCQTALQHSLGCDIRTFAYPFGRFNDSVKAAVRRNGFDAACSTMHGFNTASTDPFELRRIYIYAGDGLGEFEKKILGAYDWLGHFERRTLTPAS